MILVCSGNILQKFNAGETYDFKGWVKGEAVEGNDTWFVGRYTGGFAWSGAFTDTGVHDLTDLNPTQLLGYQRQVGDSVINYRSAPILQPDNVLKTFNPGEVLDFNGWAHGTAVDGSDVWFRGRYTGGWSHSGGFVDKGTHDLPEIVLAPIPIPPVPSFPPVTTDPEVTKIYNKKRPIGKDYAPTDLVSVGGGQQLRKEAWDSLKLMQQQTTSLAPASGYRSYTTQEKVYADNVAQNGQAEADRQSARPGYSEHQTGLTMDFGPIDSPFAQTPAHKFLVENSYKYGWILRYPSNKESVTGYMYEPWHWRYIGVAVADDMHDKGITTLEEYYNVEGGDYAATPPTDPVPPVDPVDPDPTPEPGPVDPTKNPLWAFFVAIVDFLKSIIDRLKPTK